MKSCLILKRKPLILDKYHYFSGFEVLGNLGIPKSKLQILNREKCENHFLRIPKIVGKNYEKERKNSREKIFGLFVKLRSEETQMQEFSKITSVNKFMNVELLPDKL